MRKRINTWFIWTWSYSEVNGGSLSAKTYAAVGTIIAWTCPSPRLSWYFFTNAGFFSPVRARSESENRNLAQKPAFSFEALFAKEEEKRYTVQYEKYLSDQFVGRDAWIGLKTRTERLLGKTDINGVYFAGDGYLVTKTEAGNKHIHPHAPRAPLRH